MVSREYANHGGDAGASADDELTAGAGGVDDAGAPSVGDVIGAVAVGVAVSTGDDVVGSSVASRCGGPVVR